MLQQKPALVHIIGAAVIGAAVLGGCKRLNELKREIAPAPPPVAQQDSATDIAPATAQYSSSVATPPPAPPRSLLPPKLWPKVTLSDGRVFEQVLVTGEDAATITFKHSGGLAKIDKRALPSELGDHYPYDPEAAQQEARQIAIQREAAAKAAQRPAVGKPVRPRPTVTPSFNEPNTTVSAGAITSAVRARARRYFEREKRIGSRQTLAFDLITDLSEPREVSGWAHRWEVSGEAGYRIYESIGWGSFSSRNSRFSAIVEAPPGKAPKVVSFEER